MFDIGDLVVCVDAHAPNQAGFNAVGYLVEGKHYRVTAIILTRGGPGVVASGCVGDGHGYAPFRFRKIDAPDTEVSRMIRACKPVREGQPA